MDKAALRICALGLLVASLAAIPATAQVIPKGTDHWRTPNNGQTFFAFPEGDVEALCGQRASTAWDHRAFLHGVPAPGSDWDTAVARLDDAVFDATGTAKVRIQVRSLSFTSAFPQVTPCGRIIWTVSICCPQPITWMTIRRTAANGGVFHANLTVIVEFRGVNVDTGQQVGSLYYTRELPDEPGGTAWSFGPGGVFRPGITPAETCVDVLRRKLSNYAPDSSHFYWISDMIAQGRCERATGN